MTNPGQQAPPINNETLPQLGAMEPVRLSPRAFDEAHALVKTVSALTEGRTTFDDDDNELLDDPNEFTEASFIDFLSNPQITGTDSDGRPIRSKIVTEIDEKGESKPLTTLQKLAIFEQLQALGDISKVGHGANKDRFAVKSFATTTTEKVTYNGYSKDTHSNPFIRVGAEKKDEILATKDQAVFKIKRFGAAMTKAAGVIRKTTHTEQAPEPKTAREILEEQATKQAEEEWKRNRRTVIDARATPAAIETAYHDAQLAMNAGRLIMEAAWQRGREAKGQEPPRRPRSRKYEADPDESRDQETESEEYQPRSRRRAERATDLPPRQEYKDIIADPTYALLFDTETLRLLHESVQTTIKRASQEKLDEMNDLLEDMGMELIAKLPPEEKQKVVLSTVNHRNKQYVETLTRLEYDQIPSNVIRAMNAVRAEDNRQ